ncbi:DNA pilot protein [Dipodfec virus UA23Rod_1363]|uniref:DNA pilot protein n=1 Tax=Dipodfec virus UA23Rod_1363 TaxID=2929331 RepID=A0A976N1F8_9VIRU|nr:DNA pilot protein [Dipodfec virus UA23Rod_1363]
MVVSATKELDTLVAIDRLLFFNHLQTCFFHYKFSFFMNASVASLIGSGISSLGGLFSSGLSYRSQKKLLRQQNEYNLDMANFAYDRDLDMWNRQNVYNSPSEQMARLKAAGLNPNLMYGSGSASSGNAGSAPSFNAPQSNINRYTGDFGIQQAANSISNGLNSYIDTKTKLAQLEAVRAQTGKTLDDSKRIQQDTNLRMLQVLSQQKANAKSDIELRYLDDIQQQTLSNMKSSSDLMDSQIIRNRVDAQFQDQRRLQFEAERPYRLQLVEEAVTHNKFLNSLNPLTRSHLIYRIANLSSQYTGRELENRALRTLIEDGVDLKGGKVERAIIQLIDDLESGNFDLGDLSKGLAIGALGLIGR